MDTALITKLTLASSLYLAVLSIVSAALLLILAACVILLSGLSCLSRFRRPLHLSSSSNNSSFSFCHLFSLSCHSLLSLRVSCVLSYRRSWVLCNLNERMKRNHTLTLLDSYIACYLCTTNQIIRGKVHIMGSRFLINYSLAPTHWSPTRVGRCANPNLPLPLPVSFRSSGQRVYDALCSG